MSHLNSIASDRCSTEASNIIILILYRTQSPMVSWYNNIHIRFHILCSALNKYSYKYYGGKKPNNIFVVPGVDADDITILHEYNINDMILPGDIGIPKNYNNIKIL